MTFALSLNALVSYPSRNIYVLIASTNVITMSLLCSLLIIIAACLPTAWFTAYTIAYSILLYISFA